MATTLFDVNAVVYWCFCGSPWHDEVCHALRSILMKGDDAIVAASSLNETYYTLCHHCGFSREEALQAIRNVADVFTVAPVGASTVRRALSSDEPDYEDAVVRACAEENQADFIVSCDRRAFRSSFIPKTTARELAG